ncbi:MAG: FISUMP domain-containing protein [FCB group bacterium]|jgi:uncharacterized protein (TIGR02145 family)
MKPFILIIAFLFVIAFLCKAQTNDSIRIGTQFWKTKNLDVDHYSNGDSIPEVKDSVQWTKLTTGAWCYYNNNTAIGAVYGKLYNWYAVNDKRGLLPPGWHIPANSDWNTLGTNLGGFGTAGGKLKEADTIHWHYPNTGATNKTGFYALPGGYRMYDGSFNNLGYDAWWWSAKDTDAVDAWSIYVNNMYTEMLLYYSNKHNAFSVRLVSDYTVGIEEQNLQTNVLQVQEPYPNPFTNNTNIEYNLPRAGNIFISIYTPQGLLAKSLTTGFENAGNHEIYWNGRNEAGIEAASGVYIYRIQFEGQCIAKKMFLVR